MRLMEPGMGELLDRLSILELKLAHGGEDHFAAEREQVLTAASTLMDSLDAPARPWGRLLVKYAQLAAVNAALWQGEDELRDMRTCLGNPEAVTASGFLAHKIQALNDRRSELAREIGKLVGEPDRKEKLTK